MWSRENEYVPIQGKVICEGAVEQWLSHLLVSMRDSIRYQLEEAFQSHGEHTRTQWLSQYPSQAVQVVTQIFWTNQVTNAFDRFDSGIDTALKECLEHLQTAIDDLVKLVTQPKLSSNDRQKLTSLIILGVHNRYGYYIDYARSV